MERDKNGAGLSCVHARTTRVALGKDAVIGHNAVDPQRCSADVRQCYRLWWRAGTHRKVLSAVKCQAGWIKFDHWVGRDLTSERPSGMYCAAFAGGRGGHRDGPTLGQAGRNPGIGINGCYIRIRRSPLHSQIRLRNGRLIEGAGSSERHCATRLDRLAIPRLHCDSH